MIIDTHAHIGTHGNITMTIEDIFYSMKKYKITFSLISDANGEEYDGSHNKLETINQVELNTQLLDIVRNNKSKLGALLWMKPHHEDVTKELEDLIISNRDVIYGLKFHPYHSKLSFNHPKMNPYFQLARQYALPIVTHTASDEFSNPKLVYEVAKVYPEIDFVMVHLGLGTDNLDAINYVSKLPNLYGDTTWVTAEKTILSIEKCGPNKIMFGTDNPVDGKDTIGTPFYQKHFTILKHKLSEEVYENLMFRNAVTLFKIDLKKQ